jgi:hypothetical protein
MWRFGARAFVSVLLIEGSAAAQAQLVDKTEFRLQLSPAIGEALRETEGNQPVDESEISLGLRFVHPVSKDIEIQATPEIAYSPQMYDESDPSSQLRVGLELRRRFTYGQDERPLRYTSVGKISAQLFARYTPSVGFDEAFGAHAFFDNVVAAGAQLGNDVWFHCRQRWIIAAGLGCNQERRVAVQVTPSIQYTFSDQTERRRLTPQAEARVIVPVRDIDIRLSSRFESRRFTELHAPASGLERDGRLTSAISFDFAPAIPRIRRFLFGNETNLTIINDFTLEIGARYVRNRSNDRTKNFDRVFFVPAFTYTRQLN